MIDNNVIIHEAEEYVNNSLSVEETAKVLGISKRTLQLHLQRIEKIDQNLYKRVQAKQQANQQAGRVKGGQTGKSHSHITKQQAEFIAKEMIKRGLTYRDAEAEFGIPKSTLYEVLHSDLVSKDLKDKLDILAEANIHDITTEELIERDRRNK